MTEILRGLVIRAQSRRFTVRAGDRILHAQIPKRMRFENPEVVDPVAVGDVAGKALPAALYGSFAIGLLREYAAHGEFRPAQVLEDMNFKLLQVRVDRRVLAMAFGVVDSLDRTLTRLDEQG